MDDVAHARAHAATGAEPAAGATPSGAPSRDASRLVRALAEAGLLARVEPRGALAVVVPASGGFTLAPAQRQGLVQEAQACGFSHVALEVPALPGDDATVPGDHPA